MPDVPSAAEGLRPAPFVHRNVEVNGVRLHYLDYGGEGKRPLLCLHGGGAHAHWFDFVASEFTRDFHVMSLDNRGHGDSAWAEPPVYNYENYVSDLNQVAEKLDLRDFVLMGHSMGGMISLVYAATHPGRASALIVIDSTLIITEENLAGLTARGQHGGKAHATLESYVADFKLRPLETEATPEMLGYMASRAARQFEDGKWRHKIDRRVMGTRTPINGVPYFAKIKIPTLLVKAGLSKRVTPEIIAGARAGCPQLELAEVPRSEHHITLDNPAGLRPVVRSFLDRHFDAARKT